MYIYIYKNILVCIYIYKHAPPERGFDTEDFGVKGVRFAV